MLSIYSTQNTECSVTYNRKYSWYWQPGKTSNPRIWTNIQHQVSSIKNQKYPDPRKKFALCSSLCPNSKLFPHFPHFDLTWLFLFVFIFVLFGLCLGLCLCVLCLPLLWLLREFSGFWFWFWFWLSFLN